MERPLTLMQSRRFSSRHKGGGQTLVEFAVVFPIFLVLLFLLIDIGRAVYAYNTISNAAREGARIAAVSQLDVSSATGCNLDMPIEDPSAPHWQIKQCAAKAAVSLGVLPSAVTVAYGAPPTSPTLGCSAPPGARHVGCIASVTVTYTWKSITPLAALISVLVSGPAHVGDIAMSSTSQIPIVKVLP